MKKLTDNKNRILAIFIISVIITFAIFAFIQLYVFGDADSLIALIFLSLITFLIKVPPSKNKKIAISLFIVLIATYYVLLIFFIGNEFALYVTLSAILITFLFFMILAIRDGREYKKQRNQHKESG